MHSFYYIWVAIGKNGVEYTLGVGNLDSAPLPLVFANRALAAKCKPIAQAHFDATGEKVKLIEYKHNEVLDVIK